MEGTWYIEQNLLINDSEAFKLLRLNIIQFLRPPLISCLHAKIAICISGLTGGLKFIHIDQRINCYLQ